MSTSTACVTGWSPPPPSPWRILKKINSGNDRAKPHAAELTVKIRSDAR